MSNDTFKFTTDMLPGFKSLLWYALYFCEGLIIGCANLLIVLSILRYEALRSSKVHLIMMSLAFADTCNMAGYCISGVWRTYSIFALFHDHKVSAWECALLPQTLIWVLEGSHGSAVQLLVVSIDRLLATSFPLDYIGWPTTYTLALLFVSHGWTLGTGIAGLALAYSKRDVKDVKAACSSTRTMISAGEGTIYSNYFVMAAPAFALMSVAVYLFVLYMYKKQTNKVYSVSSQNKREIARERKFTRTLGISCTCTFFLYVVPLCIAYPLRWLGLSLGTFFFTVANLNPLANIFIYQVKQPEMRLALKGLFTCKEMPIDLKQWKSNQQTQTMNQGNLFEMSGKRVVKPAVARGATLAQMRQVPDRHLHVHQI